MPRMDVAVIIPVHNEAPTLRPLAEGIMRHIGVPRYRIVFIDDGSTDQSMDEIRRLSEAHPCVRYMRIGENAGKTRALALAFQKVDADVIITMDGDLQDDPQELPRMLEALTPEVDMVCGWKQTRRDPWHKTGPSRVFNGFLGLLFGLPLHDMNTGFKVIRGALARRLPLERDMHRFLPVMAHQLGYKVTEIPVTHHPRRFGKSKYGWARYYEGARDALWLWAHPAPGRIMDPHPQPAIDVVESHL
jgi:glycosyltransferase involved in cell wall biosynthesis